MDLADQYARQYRWRSWQQALGALPFVSGARILDLGCAVGDQSQDLASLGGLVVGVDADEGLIAYARARAIEGAMFMSGDVRDPPVEGPFDGIWASFVAAYFPDFLPVLEKWRSLLRPGGWIALTEVSGLFAHEPLSVDAHRLLRAYAREAREAGRYDFDMGSRLEEYLLAAGFVMETHLVLPDRELSFAGAADPGVVQAWTDRLARMPRLQARARQSNVPLQEEFLRCLTSSAHTTECRVHYCVARRLENVAGKFQ